MDPENAKGEDRGDDEAWDEHVVGSDSVREDAGKQATEETPGI
jgi:hypothetical protein